MAETWVLNTRIDSTTSKTFSASFISAGNSYSLLDIKSVDSMTLISYDSTLVYGSGGWPDEAYRTVVFDTAPSGALLTWLQENGTKQSEPEPTIPKNACLIDGTGYSIKQGKVLIDGTAYTIKKGRTLNGGTGYDIAIAEDPIMITVVGGDTKTGSQARAYVIYNGQKYTDTTFEVQPGETVQVYLRASSSATNADKQKQQVTLNGVVVASYGSDSDNRNVIYDYTPTKSATITITMNSKRPGGMTLYSTAAIVES